MRIETDEVCRRHECREACVIVALVSTTNAPGHQVDMLEKRSYARTDIDDERVEGEWIFDVKVVAVEEIAGFLVDLFAYCEECWDKWRSFFSRSPLFLRGFRCLLPIVVA